MNEDFNKKHDWSNSDCCCDIETLRKILRLFQGRNIDLSVVTRNGIFTGSIFDLDEDLVYISSTFGNSPDQFAPLCSIVSISAIFGPDSSPDEFRDKILDFINPTCNLNPCCCTDGVADTINGIKQTFPSTAILNIRLDTDIPENVTFPISSFVKATDGIVLIVTELLIKVIPTCGINSVSIVPTNGVSE